MPASGLADAADGVIAAIPIEARNAQQARDPESVRAIAMSIALHLALFAAALGFISIDLPGLTPSLALPLEVELVDARDLQDDDAPSIEQATLPAAASKQKVSERTLTASAPSASAEPLSTASSTSVPTPGQPEATDPDTTSDESVSGESPAPQDSAVVATEVDRQSEVLVRANDPAEGQRVPMPVSEQTMLTRHIMQGVRNFDDPSDIPAKLSWEHDGQSYTALLQREPAGSDTDIERVHVEIQAQEQGKRMKTRLEMKRLAFSHFTQLVDRWDEEVQLHDDEIAGRFHSNSPIVLGYDLGATPRFLGKVTTAARGFTFGEAVGFRRRNQIFLGGFEPRTDRVTLPARFLHPPDRGVQVRSFAEDTRITFASDGSYSWSHPQSGTGAGREVISAPTYLIGGARATLFLRGVVAGKVTVYSPQRIVIESNLTYARDPRSGSTEDCLGLVSDQVIEIAGPEVTGAGDLEIDGALYARSRFVVTDLYAPKRAVLSIFGSLTAGSLSATEPRYATKIRFDARFERLRPPGFPETNRYEIDGWDTLWELMDGSG